MSSAMRRFHDDDVIVQFLFDSLGGQRQNSDAAEYYKTAKLIVKIQNKR